MRGAASAVDGLAEERAPDGERQVRLVGAPTEAARDREDVEGPSRPARAGRIPVAQRESEDGRGPGAREVVAADDDGPVRMSSPSRMPPASGLPGSQGSSSLWPLRRRLAPPTGSRMVPTISRHTRSRPRAPFFRTSAENRKPTSPMAIPPVEVVIRSLMEGRYFSIVTSHIRLPPSAQRDEPQKPRPLARPAL